METWLLILEDVDADLGTLAQQLSQAGYATACGLTEDAPLERLASVQPALIVLSLSPSNLHLLQQIRETGHGAAIPVILVGPAGPGMHNTGDALACGADAFFPTPLALGALLHKIRTFVGAPSQEPALAQNPPSHAQPSVPPPPPPSQAEEEEFLAPLHSHDHGPTDADRHRIAAEIATEENTAENAQQKPQPTMHRIDASVPSPPHSSPTHAQTDTKAHTDSASAADPHWAALESQNLQPQADLPKPSIEEPSGADLFAHTPKERQALPPRSEEDLRQPLPLETPQGKIDDTFAIADLLFLAWQRRITGCIDVSCDPKRQKALFFEDGNLSDALSTLDADRMEEYLHRQGKITQNQYQEARVMQVESPRKLGAYMVAERFLKAEELFDVLQGHLESVVLGSMAWEVGHYRYRTDLVPERDRIRLQRPVPAMILDGFRRKYLMPRLVRRVGGPATLLQAVPVEHPWIQAMAPNHDERCALRLIDGTHTLEDVAFACALSPLRVYQLAAALLTLNISKVLVPGAVGIMPDGSTHTDSIDRERIESHLLTARRGNYFQILGVTPRATPYEIEQAFARKSAELHSEKLAPRIANQMRYALEELQEILNEARDVLCDEELSAAYAVHHTPKHMMA